MAVIGKIREKSTLLLIVVGGALMAFILTDLFSSRSSVFQGDVNNIGKINGKNIRAVDFNDRYEEIVERYKKDSKGENIPDFIHGQIRDEVWKQYLKEYILNAEMDELGVVISAEELADLTYGDNPHPIVRNAFSNRETGMFNKNEVIGFLKNMERDETGDAKRQWLVLEGEMKRIARQDKYFDLIRKGIYTTTFEAQAYYKNQNQKVGISYVVKRYADVADSTVSVSEGDIKEYYNQNRNKFIEKKSRKIEYSVFRVVPSSEDSAAVKKWVDHTYAQFRLTKDDSTFVNANSDKEFDFKFYSKNDPVRFDTNLFEIDSVGLTVAPVIEGEAWKMRKVVKIKYASDSVEARHILLSTEKKNKEEVALRMDSIKSAIQTGADFAEIAGRLSEDPGSKDKGGSLGWFKEGYMIPVINDSCFKGKLNKLMVIESSFGVHLFEVTGKSPQVKKIQVATIVRSIDASRETMDGQFTASNDMSLRVAEEKDMESLAMEYNAEFNSIDIRESDFEIPEVESSRQLIRWAYEAEVGDVTEALQFAGAFVVARLLEIHEDGVAPLNRVKAEAELGAIKKKKAEAFIQEMQGVTDLNEAGKSLNLMVEKADNIAFENFSIPGLGREPELMGKIFTMQQGDLSVPIEGNGGVFIVQIDKVDAVNVSDIDIAAPKEQLTLSRATRVGDDRSSGVFEALKECSDIEDNRFRFY